MPITVSNDNKIFKLDTKNSSYIMKVSRHQHLMHLYYGKKVSDADLEYLMPYNANSSFSGFYSNDDRSYTLDSILQELSCNGCGDYRISALSIRNSNGYSATELNFKGFKTYGGKPKIEGQPATYANNDSECETLEVYLEDDLHGALVTLYYSVFEDSDAIARSVKVENTSENAFDLERIYSACYDFNNKNYDFIHLWGGWGKERMYERSPIMKGIQSITSRKGSSGHNHNPFMALAEHTATEHTGDAYGFSFVYSGNFAIDCEVDLFDNSRVLVGINPDDFGWHLEPREVFHTPEAISVYSDEGIGGMSRCFHKLFRNNLVRGPWKNKKRPIIINNWEAMRFDFDHDKLIKLATDAAALGIEMLVMDDGWFGKRNADNCALGDWYVNNDKLKYGLSGLIKEINELGLEFGIWYEPEMISPDSDLYRAHPDWALQVEGRNMSIARHQYVLDMSRADVRDYLFERMYDVLSTHNIKYVKWDFNRNLTEVGNKLLEAKRQKELYHRYVLGLYDLLERILTAFPDLLLEGCSGGGGRFDPAQLYYSPQIWASDNTDVYSRVFIQYGTSLVYPASSISAHVSAVPNKQTARVTPFRARGDVAFAGSFGYELNIEHLDDNEKQQIKEQVANYHKYYSLIHDGDLYRLTNPFDDNTRYCFEYVAQDKSEALVTLVILRGSYHDNLFVKLKGLEPDAQYIDEATGRVFSGDTLMNAGLNLTRNYHDYDTRTFHFIKQ